MEALPMEANSGSEVAAIESAAGIEAAPERSPEAAAYGEIFNEFAAMPVNLESDPYMNGTAYRNL